MKPYTDLQWRAKVCALGWRCYYCGSEVRARRTPAEEILSVNELTKDCLTRGVFGGPVSSQSLHNLVPACLRCHRLKGGRTAKQFIAERPYLCTHGLFKRERDTAMLLSQQKDAGAYISSEISEAIHSKDHS